MTAPAPQPIGESDLGRSPPGGVALLLIATVFLLPFSRLAELAVVGMALAGLATIVRQPVGIFQRRSVRLLSVFFLCYWLPQLLSLPDAVAPMPAMVTTMAGLRFWLMGVFVVTALKPADLKTVLLASAVLVIWWALDALIQAGFGVNTLGMARSPERLNGVFGSTNIKLGLILAVFAPLALESVQRRLSNRGWTILVFALLGAVVILIATRAAWIMFFLVAVTYVYRYARNRPGAWMRAISVSAVLAVLGIGFAYTVSEQWRNRLDDSLLALRTDGATLDQAAQARVHIWQTAWTMFSAHPVNGVGVRGFRYAYPAHAQADDPLVDHERGVGASHPHQIMLEAATETGVIGVVAFLIALAIALRQWRSSSSASRQMAIPFAVSLGVMLFPLNTHPAFFSTFWATVLWWLVSLYVAAICLQPSTGNEGEARA